MNNLRGTLLSRFVGLAVAVATVGSASADSKKIGIVGAGPHPYFAQWDGAGKKAAKDFDIGSVVYRFPNKYDLETNNALLESMASQGYNAYLIFPGDAVASRPTVADLVKMGSPVITIAGCLNDPSAASFCFATNNDPTYYDATKRLIEAMGGKGKFVLFTGFLTDPTQRQRIDAIKRAVKETNGAVTLAETITDLDVTDAALTKINAFLATQGDKIDGILTTGWIPSVVAANALRKIGDKRIKMIGLNNDDVVMAAIKDGFVTGTIVENAFAQAYVGAFAADKLLNGCTLRADAPWLDANQTKKMVDSGIVYVDASNVDTYRADEQAKATELLEVMKDKYLKCP